MLNTSCKCFPQAASLKPQDIGPLSAPSSKIASSFPAALPRPSFPRGKQHSNPDQQTIGPDFVSLRASVLKQPRISFQSNPHRTRPQSQSLSGRPASTLIHPIFSFASQVRSRQRPLSNPSPASVIITSESPIAPGTTMCGVQFTTWKLCGHRGPTEFHTCKPEGQARTKCNLKLKAQPTQANSIDGHCSGVADRNCPWIKP